LTTHQKNSKKLVRQHWLPSTILQGHVIAIHSENGVGVREPPKMHYYLLHPSLSELERKFRFMPNLGCALSEAADQVCLAESSETLDATDVLPELVFFISTHSPESPQASSSFFSFFTSSEFPA
jgi:hypothetical protein